jgi:hypothetical protein
VIFEHPTHHAGLNRLPKRRFPSIRNAELARFKNRKWAACT